MALTADTKQLYIPLTTIYGSKGQDGNYNLSALDVKNLNDNLWNIVKKVQGNITLSDLQSLTVDELRSNVVISNTVITQNLYAEYGDIAELTVDRLLTADKVERYKTSDTSIVNYVWIEGKAIKLMAGTTDGSTVQHTDRNGALLYWKDGDMLAMGIVATAYPVIVYAYDEVCKLEMSFVYNPDSGYDEPMIVMGAGSGAENPMAGKGAIYKGANGLELNYYNASNGSIRQLKLADDGVFITPYAIDSINFYADGFAATYNATTVGYRWTKDGTGKITQLTDVYTNEIIPVTWNAGDM